MGDKHSWLTIYLQQTHVGRMKRGDDDAVVKAPAAQSALVAADEATQLELELAIPRTLRTEFNFLKYPFFDLAGDSKRTKIEIAESVVTSEGTFRILWRVTRNAESKFPGDFEKRVHRAVEQIINTTPKPIVNPVRIGSVHFIARLMGVNADSGKNYQDIQRALKNIVKTSVEARGTFQVKDSKSKRVIDDTFHLYDRVIFRGEELPSGDLADAIYLWLGTWYLQNINNNYVVPLDWRFYSRLQGSITTRMYEFLSIHFFVALEHKRDFHEVRYKEICEYFPVVRQYPAWKARKQLKPAHDSLTRTGYFARVEWLDAGESDDWLLRYWIGPRARAEYERNKLEVRQIGEHAKPVPLPERRRRRQLGVGSDPETAPDAPGSPMVREMVEKWGFTPVTAASLVKTHSEARVREVLAWAAWGQAQKPAMIQKNPAGWIRKCLAEEWGAPAGYVAPEVLTQQQQERATREAAQRAQLEAQRLEEDWRSWVSMTPKQRVVGEVWAWASQYKREHDGQEPSPQAYADKEAELIAALPSNTEKQQQLFGFVKYPEQV